MAPILFILALAAATPAPAQSQPQGGTQRTILDQHKAEALIRSRELPAAAGPRAAEEAPSRDAIAQWTGRPVTVPWTELMLRMIVKHKVAPSRSARGLALTHVAMADAIALTDGIPQATALQRHAAAAGAAARVLGYLFPSEEHGFERIASRAIAATAAAHGGSTEEARLARAVGALAGERVIAHGEADGAAKGWNGLQLEWYGEDRWYGPGAWEPSPPYNYYPPNEPFAWGWKTWVLEKPSQFRPVPPAYASERHVKALLEVLAVNRTLTPEQRNTVLSWVDGHGSVTPPGHWNQIALDLVARHKPDEAKVTRMFAALNVALADSFVACWETKYYYWTIRPINATRYLFGIELKPPILTPPFPSYVSGHAAFSGAAARILGAYFAAEARALDAMAEEAAHSRLLGGIHYRYDNEDGLVMGRKIAELVLSTFDAGGKRAVRAAVEARVPSIGEKK